MTFSVVIPARYAASRLPGKPLLDIVGKPMIQRTFEQAQASAATAVYIATDDERIKTVAEGFGARVCMTSAEHRSGTDRLQEVAAQLRLEDQHIVVNVQADEPLIPPEAIDQVANILAANADAGIATLCETISSQEQIDNPNVVKVVIDNQGNALYFSRSAIPWQGSVSARNCFRHIGIYAYRVSTLNQFVQWAPSELEVQEKLEQLRVLSNGVKVRVQLALCEQAIPPGVDTEHELEAVRSFLAET